MLRARPCRHAHTCGLTYCTVGIPAACRLRANLKFVSGASIPTKTSGRAAPNMRRMRASSLPSRGRSRSTSNSPITASDSAGSQLSHPAACIFGPARPPTGKGASFS